MDTGLLWFDPGSRSQQVKLTQAAARFAERFGRPANCCHVNPNQVFEDPSFTIVPNPSVLPNHLWVGHDPALVVQPARAARQRTAPVPAGRLAGRTAGRAEESKAAPARPAAPTKRAARPAKKVAVAAPGAPSAIDVPSARSAVARPVPTPIVPRRSGKGTSSTVAKPESARAPAPRKRSA